jgi:hypothetical protein
MGSWAALSFGAGGIAAALGVPGWSPADRLKAAVVPLAVLVAALLAVRVWLPESRAVRYDYPPRAVAEQPLALARLTGARIGSAGRERLLFLTPRGPIGVPVERQSATGIEATPEAERRIRAFLAGRGYRTALAAAAYPTLHDIACLTWDPATALAAAYETLTRTGDLNLLRPFMDTLASAHSTERTRAFAAQVADSGAFAFRDRLSKVEMGDIFARFGDRRRAEAWYRKARMPDIRVRERLAERTMFAEGVIRGNLTMNGVPLSGARVGIVPIAAEVDVRDSFLRSGTLRPGWLRWISASAVTDAAGAFRLTNVVAGTYRVIISTDRISDAVDLRSVQVAGSPGQVFVGFAKREQDLGEIGFKVGVARTVTDRDEGRPTDVAGPRGGNPAPPVQPFPQP